MVGKGVQRGTPSSYISWAGRLKLMCFTKCIIAWDLAEPKWLRGGNIKPSKGTAEWLQHSVD